MVDPPWAPVAALFGKQHKRLCCSPCPSASRVPQTQTSPKALCGPGVMCQRPISFLRCSVYPLSSKRLPLGMASSVNRRGLRSCVTPSLGGSNPDSQDPSQPNPSGPAVAQDPTLSAWGLQGIQISHPEPAGARAVTALPSTTGGVLLVGGASGVVVGGKRTLKSQNCAVGCRSSESSSSSSAAPAPPLPMAGILRTAPGQRAVYDRNAGPAKRHPGCRGGESSEGLAMRRRRDGEGRRTGLMDKPWPVKTSPAAPGGSESPGSPAQGCCSFPVPRFPLPCSGDAAATFLPLCDAPGLLTPCPSALLLPWQGVLVLPAWPGGPRYLGEDGGVGMGKDKSGQLLVPHGSATFPRAILGTAPALYPLEGSLCDSPSWGKPL